MNVIIVYSTEMSYLNLEFRLMSSFQSYLGKILTIQMLIANGTGKPVYCLTDIHTTCLDTFSISLSL